MFTYLQFQFSFINYPQYVIKKVKHSLEFKKINSVVKTVASRKKRLNEQ